MTARVGRRAAAGPGHGGRAVAVALVLALLLAGAVAVRPTLAAWTAAVQNTGTLTTAASWAQPLYSWGLGISGRTGVLLMDTKSTTAIRAVGPETWSVASPGYNSTCAVTTAGRLYCWGYNGFGQLGTGDAADRDEPTVIDSGSTWTQVAKGYVNTCAIKSDQTLWCWGYNSNGQVGNGTTASPVQSPTQVSTTGTTTWSRISLGQYFACGIKTDDTLWCWGYNHSGRLGVGDTTQRTTPAQVAVGQTWSAVAAGVESACAIRKTDQTLWCWGNGALGRLGNGSTSDQYSPVQVGADTWSAVGGGNGHHCGIRTTGTLWCWGYGVYGALGNGGTANSSTPVQEAGLATTWAALTLTGHGGCALRTTGARYCWGENTHGQVGDASTTYRTSPVLSGAATDWTALAAGEDHVCGVRSVDQGLWCQGYNHSSKLGHYASTRAGAPSLVGPPATDWSTGSTGWEVGCAVRSDGTLWCWGDNSYGQTGLGVTGTDIETPQQVGVDTDWSSVSVGRNTTCGLRGSTLYCWGDGLYQQFGINSTTDHTTPTAAAAGTWSSVSVGDDHTCAISTAGALSCWGYNAYGQVGDGTTTSPRGTPQAVTASGVTTWASVSAGRNTTCAVAATGSAAGGLFCWGYNNVGQVGDGGTTNRSSPVRLSGTTTWSSVAVGYDSACGVRTAGTLWCWGSNNYGELGLGGTAGSPASATSPGQVGSVTTWSDVGVGQDFGCATRTDGTLWCWGRNEYAQVGDRRVDGTTNVTSPRQVPDVTVSWLALHGEAPMTLAGG